MPGSACPASNLTAVRTVRALVSRRRILFLLVSRDLKVKYSDSRLSYLWTLLDPILMGIVYFFVFTVVFERGKDIAGEPYLLYLFAALLPFQWAGDVIGQSPKILGSNARLIRSVDVPRELWVLRTVTTNFVEFLFSLPVLVALVLVFRHEVHAGLLWIPVAMALQFITLIGIALILAPVTVLHPDLERIISVVNRVLFFFCPVLYGAFAVLEAPPDMPGAEPRLPLWFREIFAANPFTMIIGFYRAGFFPGDTPDLGLVLRGVTVMLVLLVTGIVVFRRLEHRVLKEI